MTVNPSWGRRGCDVETLHGGGAVVTVKPSWGKRGCDVETLHGGGGVVT